MKISVTVYKTIELKTEIYASSLSSAKSMIEDFDEKDFQSVNEVSQEVALEEISDTPKFQFIY